MVAQTTGKSLMSRRRRMLPEIASRSDMFRQGRPSDCETLIPISEKTRNSRIDAKKFRRPIRAEMRMAPSDEGGCSAM